MENWEHTLAGLASDRLMSLKRHGFLLCGDDSQAEDLVQDALVRALSMSAHPASPLRD